MNTSIRVHKERRVASCTYSLRTHYGIFGNEERQLTTRPAKWAMESLYNSYGNDWLKVECWERLHKALQYLSKPASRDYRRSHPGTECFLVDQILSDGEPSTKPWETEERYHGR